MSNENTKYISTEYNSNNIELWGSDEEIEYAKLAIEANATGKIVVEIDGKYVIKEHPLEKIKRDNIETELYTLKRFLTDTDYIVMKIVEGVSTTDYYADKLIERKKVRERIKQLQSQLEKII